MLIAVCRHHHHPSSSSWWWFVCLIHRVFALWAFCIIIFSPLSLQSILRLAHALTRPLYSHSSFHYEKSRLSHQDQHLLISSSHVSFFALSRSLFIRSRLSSDWLGFRDEGQDSNSYHIVCPFLSLIKKHEERVREQVEKGIEVYF